MLALAKIEALRALGAHVSNLQKQVPGHFLLQMQVPLLHVADAAIAVCDVLVIRRNIGARAGGRLRRESRLEWRIDRSSHSGSFWFR